MSLYLDASVVVSMMARESASAAVARFLGAAPERPVVSELAATETASALSRLVRMGLLPRDAATSRLAEFDAWRATATTGLDIEPADFRVAGIFVRRFDLGLRAPDALHAAACRRAGHTLATLDRRLAAAAAKLDVAVNLLG